MAYRVFRLLAIVGFVSSFAEAPTFAAEAIAGPVEAEVKRVIDGDTFVAEARIWPGHTVMVSVRIRGVDAPEVRTRCAAEKQAGKKSRNELEALIGERIVTIRNITGDKFFGRVLADVSAPDGKSVSGYLLANALAHPYAGGKRVSYCG